MRAVVDDDNKFGDLYDKFIGQLGSSLDNVRITDGKGGDIGQCAAMAMWHGIGNEIREKELDLYMIGNGASASMCSHYSADLSKNAGLRARTFNDSALLTALGNDIAFEKVFSESLKFTARKGDVLMAISSSGNSPNIVFGIEQAKIMDMYVITLTGMSPVNKCRALGDLNFYVSANTYGLVESAHAALLHFWTDLLVNSRPCVGEG